MTISTTASASIALSENNNDSFTQFKKDALAGVPSLMANQLRQLYMLSLIFAQGHEAELVLQSLGFGKQADTTLLIRCLEAVFFLMQGDRKSQREAQLLKWTETIIEAFFLQLSVFGGQSTSASQTEMEEELDYA